MIFAKTTLKMVFVLVVLIVFWLIKKLGAQTKIKLKMDCNMQKQSLPYDIIYTPEDLVMN